jgi:hypothetical protein
VFTYYFSKIRSNSIHLCLGLPSDLFPSGFPTKVLYAFLSSHACYIPIPSHSPCQYKTIGTIILFFTLMFRIFGDRKKTDANRTRRYRWLFSSKNKHGVCSGAVRRGFILLGTRNGLLPFGSMTLHVHARPHHVNYCGQAISSRGHGFTRSEA